MPSILDLDDFLTFYPVYAILRTIIQHKVTVHLEGENATRTRL